MIVNVLVAELVADDVRHQCVRRDDTELAGFIVLDQFLDRPIGTCHGSPSPDSCVRVLAPIRPPGRRDAVRGASPGDMIVAGRYVVIAES